MYNNDLDDIMVSRIVKNDATRRLARARQEAQRATRDYVVADKVEEAAMNRLGYYRPATRPQIRQYDEFVPVYQPELGSHVDSYEESLEAAGKFLKGVAAFARGIIRS